MFWGDSEIEWETLATVCERLKRHHHLRSILRISSSDISFLYRRFIEPDERTHHANRFNFIYELQRSRHLHFTDDRDRVFAFLGHYSANTRSPLGCAPVTTTADYTKSVAETYVGLARQILQTNPSAACIVMASVQHPQNSLPSRRGTEAERNENLAVWLGGGDHVPSWVPDWRTSEAIILAEPICPHFAHGDSVIELELKEPGLQLRIKGLQIDTVKECSLPLVAADFYKKTSPDTGKTIVEKLWLSISTEGHFSLEDRYVSGQQSAFFSLMQTLSNGCVQAAGHECRAYHDIPDHVWLGKAAKYLTETLGNSDHVCEDIRREAAHVEREDEHEEWSRWAASASDGRAFARTKIGYYVLGPAAMEPGDVICVLFGAKVPFCLRAVGGEFYLLVGECYVHGMMKGEAMGMFAQGELQEVGFEIL